MRLFLLALALMSVAAFELPGLITRRYWRELIVFLGFFLLAAVLSVLMVLEIELPRLSVLITDAVKVVFGDWIEGLIAR